MIRDRLPCGVKSLDHKLVIPQNDPYPTALSQDAVVIDEVMPRCRPFLPGHSTIIATHGGHVVRMVEPYCIHGILAL